LAEQLSQSFALEDSEPKKDAASRFVQFGACAHSGFFGSP